jgi:hypothetical protein
MNSKLLKLSDEEFVGVQKKMEGVPYKAGVGSLMYAMMATRAHISFAVNTVSQFMLKASPLHWMAIKFIMRYMKGTLDFKLCFKGKDIVLRGFCDADVGGRCKQPAIHHGVRIFCWPWSHFVEMQETTNHCIIYKGDGIHGY